MGYYLIIFGTAVLLLAAWSLIGNLKLVFLGERTLGVVTGVDEQMRRGDSQRKKIYYHPVIEFKTVDGHPFEFTFGSGSTRKRPVIGDNVSVIYPANQPSKATLNTFMGLWAGPLAATILGAGTLYGGIHIVFFEA